jgi:hypothetical protein
MTWRWDVIYDFDRLHEGHARQVLGGAQGGCIQLNSMRRRLSAPYSLYIAPDEGFAAFAQEILMFLFSRPQTRCRHSVRLSDCRSPRAG